MIVLAFSLRAQLRRTARRPRPTIAEARPVLEAYGSVPGEDNPEVTAVDIIHAGGDGSVGDVVSIELEAPPVVEGERLSVHPCDCSLGLVSASSRQ